MTGLQVWFGRFKLFPLFSKLTPDVIAVTTKMGKPEVAFSIIVTPSSPDGIRRPAPVVAEFLTLAEG